jgi:hypothetical protein
MGSNIYTEWEFMGPEMVTSNGGKTRVIHTVLVEGTSIPRPEKCVLSGLRKTGVRYRKTKKGNFKKIKEKGIK